MVEAALLSVHVAGGVGGLVVGPVAMRAAKRPGRHTRAGELYHWLVLTTAASALVLALIHFSESWWLGLIAIFSYSFAFVGYMAAKRRPRGWLRVHISGQGGSYIALVTAFLVVNLGGPLVVWFLPTIVGSPIIAWVNYQVAIGRRPKRRAPAPATPTVA